MSFFDKFIKNNIDKSEKAGNGDKNDVKSNHVKPKDQISERKREFTLELIHEGESSDGYETFTAESEDSEDSVSVYIYVLHYSVLDSCLVIHFQV